MRDDFGNVITIENTFEEGFPNLKYPETEVIRNRYVSRNFFFIHILLAFQKQGLIKLLSVGSNWDFYEDKKQTYQAKIRRKTSKDYGRNADDSGSGPQNGERGIRQRLWNS